MAAAAAGRGSPRPAAHLAGAGRPERSGRGVGGAPRAPSCSLSAAVAAAAPPALGRRLRGWRGLSCCGPRRGPLASRGRSSVPFARAEEQPPPPPPPPVQSLAANSEAPSRRLAGWLAAAWPPPSRPPSRRRVSAPPAALPQPAKPRARRSRLLAPPPRRLCRRWGASGRPPRPGGTPPPPPPPLRLLDAERKCPGGGGGLPLDPPRSPALSSRETAWKGRGELGLTEKGPGRLVPAWRGASKRSRPGQERETGAGGLTRGREGT